VLILTRFKKEFMKAAVYIGKNGVESEERISRLISALERGGCSLCFLGEAQKPEEDTDILLSVGGDGTFLSASALAACLGIPVLGVNAGRLGFLSENRPEDIAQALLDGEYQVEERKMLEADVVTGSEAIDSWPYALNEMTVHRSGAAMLGVDVRINGIDLPTYRADGLVVSTSSGSTAYSLSVGGPIVLPESRVLIISPIAPHNLNIRPLVVPDSSEIVLKMQSRDGRFIFTADNRTVEVSEDTEIKVAVAQFSLKRVRLNRSNFTNALTEKLFWGEDIRNTR
jgi:NAD+ kinase